MIEMMVIIIFPNVYFHKKNLFTLHARSAISLVVQFHFSSSLDMVKYKRVWKKKKIWSTNEIKQQQFYIS